MAENKSTRVDFLISQSLNHSKGYTKALGQIENVEEYALSKSSACLLDRNFVSWIHYL